MNLNVQGVQLLREPECWVLQNGHLRCELDLRRGGLPALLADRAGGVCGQDLQLYSDQGTLAMEGSVSSYNESHPAMTAAAQADSVCVSASGFLVPAPPRRILNPLRYRVEYMLGAGPELQIRLELTALRARPEVKGFLALLMPVPEARAWCARTLDGLAAAAFAASRGRVWQSAEEGLDPERPELAARWPGGRRLEITCRDAGGPLENIFWHRARSGNTNLFFALLSDLRSYSWEAEQPWSLAFTARVGSRIIPTDSCLAAASPGSDSLGGYTLPPGVAAPRPCEKDR